MLYVRNDNLYSQRLNRGARRLEGEAELVVQGVASDERAHFSAARNGTIVWRPGTAAQSQITEFDRQGNIVGTSGPKSAAVDLKLSPDEKQFLTTGGSFWLVDIGQNLRTDLPKGVVWMGWVAGGSKLLGLRGDELVEMPATGSGEIRAIRKWEAGQLIGGSTSLDGQILALVAGFALLSMRTEGTADEVRPRELATNVTSERFSPDGRWAIYRTTGAGVSLGGLYAQPVLSPGRRIQIVPKSVRAVWRGDGKEILYVDGDSLMSVAVEGSGNLTFGAPRKLFSGLRVPARVLSNNVPLAISRDGSRIFWLQAVEQPESNVIHVKIGAVK